MSDDNRTDIVEGLLLAFGGVCVIMLLITQGYVPVDVFTDLRDALPKFENLGVYGQSIYAILGVLSLGSAGLHRLRK